MIHLDINSDITINQVNELFRNKFPHIRLEFFTSKTGQNIKEDRKHLIIERDVPLKEIYKNSRCAKIIVNGNLKARSLENNILDLTELHVQVFRKSGTVWLETIGTDSLTLSDLNRIGDESQVDIELDDKIDYQEQD